MNTKQIYKAIILKAMMLLSICLLISGCGAGQVEGRVVPPKPSSTSIPTPTKTPTPTLLPTSTLMPTPHENGSQIAFSTNRDGNWEIYRMGSDGNDQTRLTVSWQSQTFSQNPDGTKTYLSPVPSNLFPKLSPDGQLLLYWSYTEGNPPSSILYWMRPDGSTGEFASPVAPYTSFSPDGKTVALNVYTGENNTDIANVATGGGNGKQLTDNPANDYEPAWSPDGKTIAFVSERDDTPHIYLMDIDGSNQRRLTSNDMNELEPAWSPDGKEIAFLSEEGNVHSNIYIVDVDGTNIRNLTDTTDYLNENPAWSPDGTMIAFWSDREGNHEIYSIRLDGTGLTNLTNNPAEDENPSWSK